MYCSFILQAVVGANIKFVTGLGTYGEHISGGDTESWIRACKQEV
jgi:hypothetical protein